MYYVVATNVGKGFVTHDDRQRFWVRGYPADVWVTDNNGHAYDWKERVSGIDKTKAEAQALIDTEVESAQAAYDALSADEQAASVAGRPVDVVIP